MLAQTKGSEGDGQQQQPKTELEAADMDYEEEGLFNDVLRDLADHATPEIKDEKPEDRAKRVDSTAQRMAKKAKHDGRLKVIRHGKKA